MVWRDKVVICFTNYKKWRAEFLDAWKLEWIVPGTELLNYVYIIGGCTVKGQYPRSERPRNLI